MGKKHTDTRPFTNGTAAAEWGSQPPPEPRRTALTIDGWPSQCHAWREVEIRSRCVNIVKLAVLPLRVFDESGAVTAVLRACRRFLQQCSRYALPWTIIGAPRPWLLRPV